MFAYSHLRWVILLLFVARCRPMAEDASTPSDRPTFRTSVSEVRVTFFATDGESDPVAQLTNTDFAVVDNGMVVRTFRSFARSDETELDLVALLDVSESVAPRFRAAMSDVLQLVSREQSLPDDNIAVLSFGGPHPAILCASECRTSAAAGSLLSVKTGGLTPLYDGLVFAADFMKQRRRSGARPVLILFSDGRDTISRHSAREAIDAALTSGALIYTVDITAAKNDSGGAPFLRYLSESTGGRYFSIQEGVAAVLQGVLADLRASYVVTYELPRKQAGFHSVKLLSTRNLNLRFHHRSGYYYESLR